MLIECPCFNGIYRKRLVGFKSDAMIMFCLRQSKGKPTHVEVCINAVEVAVLYVGQTSKAFAITNDKLSAT